MGGMMSGKIKDVEGICDMCIFGQSYTSDGNLIRVCEGDWPLSIKEAHNRIEKAMESGECEHFEEGHQKYLEMKASGLGPCSYYCSLPANEKYKVDKSHSDKPVFGCNSWNSQCLHGNRDIGCFWKETGCTSQTQLDNPDKPASNDLFDALVAAGIDESKIQNLKAD